MAAGWAVDDATAALFADRLYAELLDGQPFGEALRTARAAVYERHPHTNTWGAYQAYGDPGYRLVRDGAAAGSLQRPTFVAPREAILALDTIRQHAQTMVVRDPEELRRRLGKVVAGLPDGWSAKADVLSAIAEAHAELGDVARAIEAYEQALTADRAATPVRTIEQLINLRARRAVDLPPVDARRAIRQEIALLDKLTELAGGKSTTERLSLLGSCEKRLAQVSSGRQRLAALGRMSKAYREAHELAQQRGKLDTYPLINWLLAEALLAVLGGRAPSGELLPWLDHAEAEARPADRAEPRFWNLVTLGDVALGRRLLAVDLATAELQNEVAEAYLRAWRRGASRLKFASVLENLRFVAETLADTGAGADLRPPLLAIASRLAAETGLPPPAPVTATAPAGRSAATGAETGP